MTNPSPQYRDWIFTLNNPEPSQIATIHNSDQIRYMIYQLELSNSGTKHLQGYVEFFEAVSFKEALDVFSSGNFHLERRRGTREQARNYCSKEDSRIRGPWILGEWYEEEEDRERCLGITLQGKRCQVLTHHESNRCYMHRKES